MLGERHPAKVAAQVWEQGWCPMGRPEYTLESVQSRDSHPRTRQLNDGTIGAVRLCTVFDSVVHGYPVLTETTLTNCAPPRWRVSLRGSPSRNSNLEVGTIPELVHELGAPSVDRRFESRYR